MKSIAAVAATRTASATQRERSSSTTAAQMATAFISARSAILITKPGAPENAAIDRATSPGRNGSFGAAAVAVLTAPRRGHGERRAGARDGARSARLGD